MAFHQTGIRTNKPPMPTTDRPCYTIADASMESKPPRVPDLAGGKGFHPRQFKNLLLALLALVFLASAAPAPAELYQTIRVNVMSHEKFRVARIEYPLEEMTRVLAGEIRGPDRVRVKLYIPLGMKKTLIEEIKIRCRQAGATSFFIQYKA